MAEVTFKSKQSFHFLFTAIISVMLVHMTFGRKCDNNLLRTFFLTGMEDSLYQDMNVCPFVRERCCTLYDEIKISHLWRSRSRAMLQRHKDRTYYNVKTLIDYFDKLTSIDPLMIIVKQSVVRQMAYPGRFCQTTLQVINQEEVEDTRRYFAQSSEEVTKPKAEIKIGNTFVNRNPTGFNPFLQQPGDVLFGYDMGKYFTPIEDFEAT